MDNEIFNGHMRIVNNAALKNLTGLGSLNQVYGTVSIADNTALDTLEGLNLQYVKKLLEVRCFTEFHSTYHICRIYEAYIPSVHTVTHPHHKDVLFVMSLTETGWCFRRSTATGCLHPFVD